jgi:hypothetical protein
MQHAAPVADVVWLALPAWYQQSRPPPALTSHTNEAHVQTPLDGQVCDAQHAPGSWRLVGLHGVAFCGTWSFVWHAQKSGSVDSQSVLLPDEPELVPLVPLDAPDVPELDPPELDPPELDAPELAPLVPLDAPELELPPDDAPTPLHAGMTPPWVWQVDAQAAA